MARKLYPKELAYAREIYGDSIDYDRVRLTKNHPFSYGSTRVVGNTIHFAPVWGGRQLFEDTPEQHLTQAGMDLLGHEIGHVWQYQHGGWAYAGASVGAQLHGFYVTGSRNAAYDWKDALKKGLPWEEWGAEQQAEAIDEWNLASRYGGDPWIVDTVRPYLELARRGEGAPKFSLFGAAVSCAVAGSVGYLLRGQPGARTGVLIGILVNLPWNWWRSKQEAGV